MGYFAFKTSDTHKSFIPTWWYPRALLYSKLKKKALLKATLLTPNNEKFTGTYDGYGRVINDKVAVDIFAAAMAPTIDDAILNRKHWKNKFFENYEGNLGKIRIVENPLLNYDDVEHSEQCPQ